MKRFAFLFFLPLMLWGQANWACNFKGSVTLAGAGPSFPNNTAAPQCNAFALTWSSTGFSGLTIELQGSDNNSSWTTFTGSSTVLVGTNPQSTLSGAIVVQASSTLAFIRVNVTSVTGTGSISYQIYGGNGILPSASAGGGGGGSCGTLGGDLSGTCTAATVVGVNGAAVPASATLTGTNSSKQIIAAALASGDFFVGSAGNLPVGVAMSGDATLSNIGALNVSGINGGTVPALTQPLATNSSSQIVAAVVQGNGSKVQLSTGSTTLNDCVKFDGNGNTVDAGGACGSGGSGGGGIVTYSSSADTLLGTQYLPPGGGAPLNSTESDNQVASGASATLSNFHVQVSAALGIGASAVFTWRDGGSSEPLTCTISGAVAVSCADTTHSFNVSAGDLIDVLVVTTGTPGVVNILFTAAFGTSNVGVTSVFGNSGPTITSLNVPTGDSLQPTGTGSITATQVPTAATASTTTNGVIIYDTTNDNLHTSSGSADAVVAVTPTATPVNGDCAQWTKVSGKIQLGDAGAACGSGSGGGTTPVSYPSAITCNGTATPYQFTASIYSTGYCDGSSVLHLYYKGIELTQPVPGNFSWTNQGSSTVSTTNGGSYFDFQNSGSTSTPAFREYLETYPSSTWTITTAVVYASQLTQYQNTGLGITDGTKIEWMYFGSGASQANLPYIAVQYCSTNTCSSFSFPFAQQYFVRGIPDLVYLQLQNNGTNHIWSYSVDGVHFNQVLSESKTANMTATNLGIISNVQSTVDATLWVPHFLQH